MSAIFLVDDNSRISAVRDGHAVGGRLSLPVAVITENAWVRLMPSDNAATISSELDMALGIIRNDLLNTKFESWTIRILNAGYQQEIRILSLEDSGACRLSDRIKYYEGIPKTAVEWVIYPKPLLPLSINNLSASADKVQIGVSKNDRYAASNAGIKILTEIRPGRMVKLPFSRWDTVWYRYESKSNSGTNQLSWGEHEQLQA